MKVDYVGSVNLHDVSKIEIGNSNEFQNERLPKDTYYIREIKIYFKNGQVIEVALYNSESIKLEFRGA